MEDKGFYLYICPRCNELLIQVDEVRHVRYACQLDAQGGSGNDDGIGYGEGSWEEATFDHFICADCYTGSKTPDEYGNILKKMFFNKPETMDAIKELAKAIMRETDCEIWGIPLDREELKAIIMEDSIGN